MQRSTAILVLAAALLLQTGPARADDTYVSSVEEAWANAVHDYARRDYRAAFGNFFWAAIRDHAQAQEMVGLMYLLGPQAFGTGVRMNRGEAAFWFDQARTHGSDVARHLHCVLARTAGTASRPAAERALACIAAQQSARAGARVNSVRTAPADRR
jgi:TPR repeat protein